MRGLRVKADSENDPSTLLTEDCDPGSEWVSSKLQTHSRQRSNSHFGPVHCLNGGSNLFISLHKHLYVCRIGLCPCTHPGEATTANWGMQEAVSIADTALYYRHCTRAETWPRGQGKKNKLISLFSTLLTRLTWLVGFILCLSPEMQRNWIYSTERVICWLMKVQCDGILS